MWDCADVTVLSGHRVGFWSTKQHPSSAISLPLLHLQIHPCRKQLVHFQRIRCVCIKVSQKDKPKYPIITLVSLLSETNTDVNQWRNCATRFGHNLRSLSLHPFSSSHINHLDLLRHLQTNAGNGVFGWWEFLLICLKKQSHSGFPVYFRLTDTTWHGVL